MLRHLKRNPSGLAQARIRRRNLLNTLLEFFILRGTKMSFCKAKFKGTCVVCENPIEVGEFIVVLGKGSCRHKDCKEDVSVIIQETPREGWQEEQSRILREQRAEKAYEENMKVLGYR